MSKRSELSSHCLIRLNFDCLDFTVEIGFSVPRAFSLPSLTPLLHTPRPPSPVQFRASESMIFHLAFGRALRLTPYSLRVLTTHLLQGPLPHFPTLSHISEPSDFLPFSISLCETIYGILDTFSAVFTSSSAYHKVS